MKNNKKNKLLSFLKITMFVIIFGVIAGGCDFLEVEPVGKTTTDVYFSTMDGLNSGIVGCYSVIYDFYDSETILYPEVAGNMVTLKSLKGNGMINQYNYTSTGEQETGAVGHIWLYGYEALANINNVIKYAPLLKNKYPSKIKEIDNIIAQALYMRALVHFEICKVYAQSYNYTGDASHLGIPLVLTTLSADANPKRSSVKEVYNAILDDLKLSIKTFPSSEIKTPYYASYWSAKALLSRVYLYMNKWNKCIKVSSEIIDNFDLSKGEDYINMYNKLEPGDETIFRINGTLKRSSVASYYNHAKVVPADTLLGMFCKEDIRLRLLKKKEKSVCLKYTITKDVPQKEKHYDIFVSRLSEIILNRAESYFNVNKRYKAFRDVSAIVGRAVNKEIDNIPFECYMEPDLEKLIIKERAKELCFEGHQLYDITRRKHDLIRESKTNSIVKRINYPSDYFVLPISQIELNVNENIEPNPTVNN